MASAVPDPSLPHAPESVQKWLRQEDWEALTKAWQEAEAQAIAWADASDTEEARMEELYQEASHVSLQPSVSVTSLPPLSRPGKQKRRKKKQWNEDFGLLGKDTGKPMALRRYFDRLANENSVPKGVRGDGDPNKLVPIKLAENLATRRNWVETHHQTVSPDNEALHPHLRSYFDRRGLESCYRQRPHVNATTKLFPPRTPQRPSTREKIMRYRSVSEPSLQSGSVMSNNQPESEEEESMGVEGRHTGGVYWGTRCQMVGTADFKAPKPKDYPSGSPLSQSQKIPWVKDHHVSVTYDNVGLNPMLRHYFDADGLESSFRNRGQHYGRPPRDKIGLELHNLSLMSKKKGSGVDAFSASGYDSVRSSLLEQISSTPGGFPDVGGGGVGPMGGRGGGSGAVSVGSGSVGYPYGGAYVSSGEDDTPP